MGVVEHSISPVYDSRSRVLVLGTMPSPASRELGFFYGHPRNRFWPVMARLAGEPVPATNERKRDFCLRHHIALWDVLASCDIDGASDASIRDARPNDLTRITSAAPIEAVFCTGAKSFELFGRLGCEEMCGLQAVKLPSTSPANAVCSFDALLNAYAAIFQHAHEFEAPVLDVERVVALEREIAAAGTSLAELMDRAGAFLAHRVEAALERAGASSVAILCGSGNNGGDGWVAAELLARAGRDVVVVTTKMPDGISAQPARDAAARALGAEGGRFNLMLDPASSELLAALDAADVVVDALLGTGFNHESVKEPYRSWIEAANRVREGRTVIAVDVPSGLDAQTGRAADVCVNADETVAMIACKPGLTASECGAVCVAPLAYIEPLLTLG